MFASLHGVANPAPWAYITHTFYNIRSTRDPPKERKLTESRQACSLFTLVGAYLAALVRDEIELVRESSLRTASVPHINNLGNNPQ